MDDPGKNIPEFRGNLKKNIILVPQVTGKASGIIVHGKRLRTFLFTTDVAIIRNHNADAVMAVYPFTPQPVITHALMAAADVPVFCGVGGGLTSGNRSVEIAVHAEHQDALGVVLEEEDIEGRIKAGTDIFNVSGGSHTASIVKKIREIDPYFPIIAGGGKTDGSILAVIEAGANAISISPPTTAELFKPIMLRYRNGLDYSS